MQISKIGEFGLIGKIKKMVKVSLSVVKGIGDDCAVLKFDRNNYLLATSDMIVEGVDFTSRQKPYFIGRKALAVSLSDIAACAGIPQYALISLGIPKGKSVEFIQEIYRGLLGLVRKYHINIVGGDISRARQLTLDVTVLGKVEKNNLTLREGARPGDIIFTSGTLGGSILGKHLKFTPRLKEARYLVDNFKINAMIDISDGLVSDLGHILEASRTGAVIYEKLIPLSRQARNLADALYSGEDFELVFTLSHREAKRLLNTKGAHFYPIGEILPQRYGLRLVTKQSQEKMLPVKGFRHF